MNKTTAERFDVSAPSFPGTDWTDWLVYDLGERISIDKLVREANSLEREIYKLRKANSRLSAMKLQRIDDDLQMQAELVAVQDDAANRGGY